MSGKVIFDTFARCALSARSGLGFSRGYGQNCATDSSKSGKLTNYNFETVAVGFSDRSPIELQIPETRQRTVFSVRYCCSTVKDECPDPCAPKTKKMAPVGKYKIVMVRHGESEWNEKNLFCGWYDAKLNAKGKKEAERAGEAIKAAGLQFDIAFSSLLTRANETLTKILEKIGQTDITVWKSWRLNERHYGGLTGLNKAETAAKYGEDQVKIWRRSFDIPPPPMESDHPYYKEIVCDPRYAEGPVPEEFPKFESLKLTIERTLPYWNDVIIPQVKAGKRVIIAAHGNSLRGVVKHLDNLSNEAIMELNLPTGIPFVYELDENLKPVVSMKFLGDEETVKKAMESVAAQGKSK